MGSAPSQLVTAIARRRDVMASGLPGTAPTLRSEQSRESREVEARRLPLWVEQLWSTAILCSHGLLASMTALLTVREVTKGARALRFQRLRLVISESSVHICAVAGLLLLIGKLIDQFRVRPQLSDHGSVHFRVNAFIVAVAFILYYAIWFMDWPSSYAYAVSGLMVVVSLWAFFSTFVMTNVKPGIKLDATSRPSASSTKKQISSQSVYITMPVSSRLVL